MGYPSRSRKGLNKRKDIYIFCEGTETEVQYFNCIKQLMKVHTVKVRVKGVGQSSKSLLDYAYNSTRGIKDMDSVWIVFDKDDIDIKEIEHTYKLAKQRNVNIAFSNCSFEVWFLLHFEKFNSKSRYDRKIIYRKLEKHLELEKYENHKSDFKLINKIADLYAIAVNNCNEMLKEAPKITEFPYTDVARLVSSLKK